MNVFQPIIEFLAAQTAGEAEAEWPKGPKGHLYRSVRRVPIAQYVNKLRALETSPGLQSEDATKLAQRLRRLHFSKFISQERKKGPAAKMFDELIADNTHYAQPPLTLDHASQELLDFFWSCDSIGTASGAEVDISHVWALIDFELSGSSGTGVYNAVGEVYLDVDSLQAIFSWAGDLGSAVNGYIDLALATNAARDRASRIQYMQQGLSRASKADLLGDMDAVVLAREANEQRSSLVLSHLLLTYYQDDALSQNAAKALLKPCSARRFHYFLACADPSFPADGKTAAAGQPLEVTIDWQDMVDHFNDYLLEVADDLADYSALRGTSSLVDRAGRDLYDKLCERLADFLLQGLATGDAPWPPANWN